MNDQSSPEDPIDEELTAPSLAAVEALDLALVNSSLLALIYTYICVAWLNVTGIPAVSAIITFDLVVVFLIVPHTVASWLNCDIDSLLAQNTSDA